MASLGSYNDGLAKLAGIYPGLPNLQPRQPLAYGQTQGLGKLLQAYGDWFNRGGISRYMGMEPFGTQVSNADQAMNAAFQNHDYSALSQVAQQHPMLWALGTSDLSGGGVPQDIVQQGANWVSDKVRSLFHGTGAEGLQKLGGSAVYLTGNSDEAMRFAEGVHLGGTSGTPKVLKIDAAPGKVLNVDQQLFDAMNVGDDVGDALEKAIESARKQGYRYVEFTHPTAIPEGQDFTATVSLYPKEDLAIKGRYR